MRTLCVVDFENLAATPHLTPAIAERALYDFTRCADPSAGSEWIGASSHHNAIATWFVRRSMRRLTASGPSGADRALIEVLENEEIDRRFTHVVIGSGDGLFAPSAARLGATGVVVTAVSWRASCSRELRMAAASVRYLDELADGLAVAA